MNETANGLNFHGLVRSSPKGGPFLGRCRYCGLDNLPMKAALEPCSQAPSQSTQIIDALTESIEELDGIESKG